MIYKNGEVEFSRPDFIDVTPLYGLQRLRAIALDNFRNKKINNHDDCFRSMTALYALPNYNNFEKWKTEPIGLPSSPWLDVLISSGSKMPLLYELEEDFCDIFQLDDVHLAFYEKNDEIVVENYKEPPLYVDVFDSSDRFELFPEEFQVKEVSLLGGREMIVFNFYSPLAEGFIQFDAPEDFEWEEDALVYIGFKSKEELLGEHFSHCIWLDYSLARWSKKYDLLI
jgi:hypothetical protein